VSDVEATVMNTRVSLSVGNLLNGWETPHYRVSMII
jgi:hypothetical protein